jgi:hypothetical protein
MIGMILTLIGVLPKNPNIPSVDEIIGNIVSKLSYKVDVGNLNYTTAGLENIFILNGCLASIKKHLKPLRKVFVNIHVCNDEEIHSSIFHYNIDKDLSILDLVPEVCTPIISVVSQIENIIYVLRIHVEKLSRFSSVCRSKGLNR